MSDRLVREQPRHCVPRHALGTALLAPRIGLNNPTLDHGPVGLESLSDSLKAELIQTAKRGQVRANEGSGMHVEVFRRMGSVRTSILEDPDPYPTTGTRSSITPSSAKNR